MFSKVKAAGNGAVFAGALVTAIVAFLGAYEIEVSPTMAAALASFVAAVVAYLRGWFKVEEVGSYK